MQPIRVTPTQISSATGLHVRWISARFKHLAEDYLVNGCSQYKMSVLLSYCKVYKSNTLNVRQKAKSEGMVKILIKYLEELDEQSNCD